MREVVSSQTDTSHPVIRLRLWSELAGLALMLMEMTWVTAYYAGFARGKLPWMRVALVLGGLMIISHFLARGLNFTRVNLRARRVIFLIWLLLTVFGSLRTLVFAGQTPSLGALITRPFSAISEPGGGLAEFWHVALAAGLVLRGVSLARERVSSGQALRSFQVGLLAFMAYGLMLSRFGEMQAYEALFAFLFFAVLTMASARIAGVSDLRGGKVGRFSADWMAGILLAAVALAGLALGIGVLLRVPLGFLVDQITLVVLVIFSAVTLVITYPLILLLTWLSPFLEKLFSNLGFLSIFQEIQEMAEGFAEQQSGFLEGFGVALNTGRVLTRIGVVLLILLAVLAALRWRPVLHRETGEEQVTNLRAMFRLPKLRLNPRAGLGLLRPSRWLAAARIRRIYAELMELVDKLGHPRREALTPLEFLPELNGLFPDRESDLDTITQAYLQVRYGQLPESAESVKPVELAWGSVRADGRRQLAKIRSEQVRSKNKS